MAQDLKKLFEKERKERKYSMKSGHEDRFMDRLDKELPLNTKRNYRFWFSMAASIVVLFGLGIYFITQSGNIAQDPDTPDTNVVNVNTEKENEIPISLGDLSPDLKKIEDYYVASINLQLSELEFNDDNKALVDAYMEQLAELDGEYNRLNQELNELGPNDDTISALINNLQLRLQLLQKLKTKLNQLKSSKNEQESSYSI
ncbi:hypothetical protein [Flagellimonas meridianipacifica]|uniref:Anti-sigma factor n=1 Tax=Flagellimonas meridianipacifica TaxID=1080225 RepID=A0A2T0M9B5_9FLAO|nr:hypothetical protein [Allomuricauda pacifica]PRX54126.1 hypothetical protein CLV81_2522 [Allomuricauda pacifica]